MTNKNRWLKIFIGFLGLLLVIGSSNGATAQVPEPFLFPGEPVGEFAPGDVIVKFKEGLSIASSQGLMGRYDAQFVETIHGSDIQRWQVMEGQEHSVVEALNADPGVAYAELNYIYYALDTTPNDPTFSNQWGHAKMESEQAWDYSTGPASVTIAIVDSGIDETHPDLASKIVSGKDFIDNDNNPHDTNGHGTHVAGISAAIGNNNVGVAGVSWGARIMPVRVLGITASGTTAQIVAGINWAYQNGADVINLSLGGTSYVQSMQDAVTAAHNSGVVVIAAMGNCRTGGGSCPGVNLTMYPAAYNNVMAVASTGPTDEISNFSQYGAHCDVSAPGGNMQTLNDPKGIYSTMPTYAVYLTSVYGYSNQYDYLHGTSQAAPQVAGLAALLLGINPSLTPDQVQTIIQNTADDLGPAGWDQDYGHGRINAFQALKSIAGPIAPTIAPINNPLGVGNYTVNWNDVTTANTYTLQEDDNASFSSPSTAYSGAISQASIIGKTGGTWYYRVKASNSAGDSSWSNTASVAVKPNAPVLNAISNPGNTDAYSISWSAPVGADGYLLQEANNAAFTGATTKYMGTDVSYAVSGQPGGSWYYRVQAYNDAPVPSAWSNYDSTSVTASPLGAPGLFPINNLDQDAIFTVDWTGVPDATSYILEESDNPYFVDPDIVYSGAMTETLLTTRQSGTLYYRVRAADLTGQGPWSQAQSTFVKSLVFLPLVMKNYASVLPAPACTPDPAGESDNIDDALLICSGQIVTGQVSDADLDDVYRIYAVDGQHLAISLSGAGGDADLYLYVPGSVDVTVDAPVAASTNYGNSEAILGTVKATGYWYIDVFSFMDTTNYSLTATVSNSTTSQTIAFTKDINPQKSRDLR